MADYTYSAELDNTQIIKAWSEMNAAAMRFEKSSLNAVRSIATQLGAASNDISSVVNVVDRAGTTLYERFSQGKLSAAQFDAEVKKLANSTMQLAKELTEVATLELKEPIDTKRVSDARAEIAQLASVVRSFGDDELSKLADDVETAEDGFATLFVNGEVSLQRYLSELLKLQSLLSKVKGSGIRERVETIKEPINQRSVDESINRINALGEAVRRLGTADLVLLADNTELAGQRFVSLYRQGEISFSQLTAELKKLQSQLEKEAKVNFGDLKSDTNTKVAEQSLRKIATLYSSIKNNTDGIDEATKRLNDSLLQSAIHFNNLFKANRISATDYQKQLAIIEKQLAGIAEGKVEKSQAQARLSFDTTIAENSLARIQEIVNDTSVRGQADFNKLAIAANKAAQNAKSLFESGQLSAADYRKEVSNIASTLERETTTGGSFWRLAITLDHLGVQGVGTFLRMHESLKGVSSGTALAAVAMGGLLLVGSKLLSVFINIGKSGVQALGQVLKSSVEIANQFDLSEKQLSNVFVGNVDIARSTLGEILHISEQYGIDLSKVFARVFLPTVESFEQFKELARLASTLSIGFGISDEQTANALKQAQSGYFRSLQETFGLLESDIKSIKQLQDDLGETDGLIAGLQKFFDRTGQQWDTYAGTLERVRGTFDIMRREGGLELGEPIRAELVVQLQKLIDLINENRDEIISFLRETGMAIASLIRSIGELDLSEIIDAETLDTLVIAIQSISAGLTEAIGHISESGTDINGVVDFVLALTTGFGVLIDQIAIVGKAMYDLGQIMNPTNLFHPEKTKEAFDDLIDQINNFANAQQDVVNRVRDMREEANVNNVSDGLEQERDDILAANAAWQEYQRLLEAAIEARKTFNDALMEAQIDNAQRLEDANIDYDRAVIDAAIDATRDRIDLLQDYHRKIKDINRTHLQDINDATVDNSREVADIYRDNARREAEIVEETNDKIEDIEKEHLRKLQDIRAQFAFDAEEAIRQNDAVAYLRLKRRMEFELQQADIDRQRKIEDAQAAAEEEREEIRRQLQYQLEDQQINNQRKLEDLQLAHQRRLEEAKIEHQQALEDQRQSEIRKREDLKQSYNRQLEDFKLSWDRKLAELRRRYEEELRIIAEYENRKRQLMQSFNGAGTGGAGGTGSGGGFVSDIMMQQLRNLLRSLATAAGNLEVLRNINSYSYEDLIRLIEELQNAQNAPGRATGGLVTAGQTYRVNETGAEFFTPTQNGLIAPLSRLQFTAPLQQPLGQKTVNNALNASVSLLDPTAFSPTQLLLVQSIVTDMLSQAFRI